MCPLGCQITYHPGGGSLLASVWNQMGGLAQEGPLRVSLGPQMARPPLERGDNIGVLWVPDHTTSLGGGLAFVFLGCQMARHAPGGGIFDVVRMPNGMTTAGGGPLLGVLRAPDDPTHSGGGSQRSPFISKPMEPPQTKIVWGNQSDQQWRWHSRVTSHGTH